VDILLVNPLVRVPLFQRFGEPLGLESLAGCLEADGHAVRIVDCNALHWFGEERGLEAEVRRRRPELIGVTLYGQGLRDALELIGDLWALAPGAHLVVGGHEATARAEELLALQPAIGAVALGEGERTLCELAAAIASGDGRREWERVPGLAFRGSNGSPVRTAARPLLSADELTALPLPSRQVLWRLWERRTEIPWGVVPQIATSRGCRHRCTYCSIAAFYGQQEGPKWRLVGLERVRQEVAQLVEAGMAHIGFVDDSFFVSRARVEAICGVIEELGTPIEFTSMGRADDIARCEDLLPRLRRAGCRLIEVGFESGAASVLERYDKRATVEHGHLAAQATRRAGIEASPDMIMFDPWTTLDEIAETLGFLKRSGLWRAGRLDMLLKALHLTARLPITARAFGDGLASDDGVEMTWEFRDERVARLYRYLEGFWTAHMGELEDLWDRVEGLKGSVRAGDGDGGGREQGPSVEVAVEGAAVAALPFMMLEDLLDHGPEAYTEVGEQCVSELAAIARRIEDLARRLARQEPEAARGGDAAEVLAAREAMGQMLLAGPGGTQPRVVWLNETASRVWKGVTAGQAIGEVVADLAREPGVDPARLPEDVTAVVSRLAEAGMLQLASGGH
jgi:radical SAM superfamily enzyme YgiQ (UPF0313 family)